MAMILAFVIFLLICGHMLSACSGFEESECGVNKWRCADGRCIYLINRCDESCSDDDDEIGCGAFVVVCNIGYRPCSNGHCVKKDYFCDGIVDCADHSDERYCQAPTKTPSQWPSFTTHLFTRTTTQVPTTTQSSIGPEEPNTDCMPVHDYEGLCWQQYRGYFPFPEDCRKFIVCEWGYKYDCVCPPNTRWHQEALTCVWEYMFPCNPVTSTVTPVHTTATTTAKPTTTEARTTTETTTTTEPTTTTTTESATTTVTTTDSTTTPEPTTTTTTPEPTTTTTTTTTPEPTTTTTTPEPTTTTTTPEPTTTTTEPTTTTTSEPTTTTTPEPTTTTTTPEPTTTTTTPEPTTTTTTEPISTTTRFTPLEPEVQ